MDFFKGDLVIVDGERAVIVSDIPDKTLSSIPVWNDKRKHFWAASEKVSLIPGFSYRQIEPSKA
jgi:hypothetical protein